MSILENHFYYGTISKLTGVFGSLFDNIKIKRKDNKTILVPIAYETKQMYTYKRDVDILTEETQIKIILPRMSFKLTGMVKDNSRLLNKHIPLIESGVDRTSALSVSRQYNRIPYTFSYILNLKTKTMDDLLQIIEQVVVFFNPSVKVIINDNLQLNNESAIIVRLIDSGIESMFEGSFENEQILEATLNFELDGWLYMPTEQAKIIRKTIVNSIDLNSGEILSTDIEVP